MHQSHVTISGLIPFKTGIARVRLCRLPVKTHPLSFPPSRVNRQRSAGFAALASGPLTPRSPTTYATPSTVSTVAHDSPYNSKFRFETSSNESEDSTEVTYPRYTYRVSPSPGEVGIVDYQGTPRSGTFIFV